MNCAIPAEKQHATRPTPPPFFSLSCHHRIIYCYALHLSGKVRDTISSLISAKTILWTPGISGSSSIYIVSPVANPFISSDVTITTRNSQRTNFC